jgi:hypothetical protein
MLRMGKGANAGPSTPLRFAQDDSAFRCEMGKGQGNHGDVPMGVQVAGLEGHVSRSAVYLIHKGLGRRRAEEG